MKKIFFLLATITLSTVSCDNFLDTEPIDKIDIHQYYTDEQGLTQALAGVYDAIGSSNYGEALPITLNACTDEGFYARSGQTTGAMVNNYNTADPVIANFWTILYQGINRANDLIAHVDLPQMDETKRQTILGEALFLRGFYHFLLVSHFGSVPIKLTPTTNPNDVYDTPAPIKDVYAQILKDMTEAEGKVHTSAALGYPSRVSKTVVEGVLARVCLQMAGYPLKDTGKYAEALAWTKKVQSSGEHALLTTYDASLNTLPSATTIGFTNSAYRQVFINMISDKYDVKESMWEADFKGNRTDGYAETGRIGSSNGITLTSGPFLASLGYSYGFIRGTARLFKAYKTGDLRRDWVLTPYTLNATTGAEVLITNTSGYGRDCAKFRRKYENTPLKEKNHTSINFPLMRYADVLLMLAEAENQVNGPTAVAYEAVNQVRRRAYGLNIATPSLMADLAAGLSKVDFQLAVENERYLELCFEGSRRLDLIRWEKLIPVMKSVAAEIRSGGGNQAYGALGGENLAEKHLLLPIPLKEISINKNLTQNTGW
jgi:hypothetical protein